MATYNGQQHIRRQLDSLAAQSQIPAELIITDDGSGDDTLAIINEFAKTASFPVNVHRNETRLGYRRNFMLAASLCRSELIAFCDQDDYWYPRKIAETVKPFSDPEVLLAYHNADVVTSDGKRIGSLSARAAKQCVLMPMSSDPWMFALGFTEVFRRSLLRLSGLWPNSLDETDQSLPAPHDRWVYFLAAVFGKIAYLDEPLAAYVQHGSNTYGWEPGFRKLKYFFRDRADELSRYALCAESQANILEAAEGNLEGAWRERAAAAAERYRKLSWLYARRNTLYSSADLADRVKAFRAILGKGGYMGTWSLGTKSFFTDMCLGIPIGALLRSAAGRSPASWCCRPGPE